MLLKCIAEKSQPSPPSTLPREEKSKQSEWRESREAQVTKAESRESLGVREEVKRSSASGSRARSKKSVRAGVDEASYASPEFGDQRRSWDTVSSQGVNSRRGGDEQDVTPEKHDMSTGGRERGSGFGSKGGIFRGLQTEKRGLDKLRDLDKGVVKGSRSRSRQKVEMVSVGVGSSLNSEAEGAKELDSVSLLNSVMKQFDKFIAKKKKKS